MVDAKFISRARHFIPLSLLRYLADLPSAIPPEAISYVGEDGINAIKGMCLGVLHFIAGGFLNPTSQSHASNHPRPPQRAKGACNVLGCHPHDGRSRWLGQHVFREE